MFAKTPKTTRVYIQLVDPDRKQPGKSLTVYETTPAEVLTEFQRFIASRTAASPTQPFAGSAAALAAAG